jgi:hypothetical protein
MDADDSKLSQLMKSHKTEYIEDSGFTSRVMAALPRDRRIARNRRRLLLLGSSILLSVPLSLFLAGPGFLPGLLAQVQFAIDRPFLVLPGLSLGVLPVACFALGLGAAASLSFGLVRRALR